MAPHPNWEADKMLDIYIHDYLSKKGYEQTAKSFRTEANVSTDPVAINAPGGFLFEWWSVFWDIFIARTNDKHSEIATSYIKTQQITAREEQVQLQQLQQTQLAPLPQGNQPESSHQSQQGNQHQSSGLNLQHIQMLQHRQLQQRSRDAVNQLGMTGSQGQGASLHTDMLRSNQTANALTTKLIEEKLKQSQSFRSSGDINMQLLNSGGAGSMQGSQGAMQNQNMFSPRHLQQLQMLNSHPLQQSRSQSLLQPPQQQQQQLQGNNDVSEGRLRELLNFNSSVRTSAGKVDQQFSGLDGLSGNDQNVLLKIRNLPTQPQSQALAHLQIQANLPANMASNPNSSDNQEGKGEAGGAYFPAGLDEAPGALKGSEESERKRKYQYMPLEGVAQHPTEPNSVRDRSPAQTASNHVPPDADMADLQDGQFNMLMDDGTGLDSPSHSHHLGGMEHYADDPSMSFLRDQDEPHSQQPFMESNKESPSGGGQAADKGFSFKEIACLDAGDAKVICCHFSNDGKLLASAGHGKKAMVWSMDNYELYTTLEEHTDLITDVRFSPVSTRLATSSFDMTVRVWDINNSQYSLAPFQGHQASVMSVDFHPCNEDLLVSCDGDSEVRYWSVNQGGCTRVFKGATSQLRFQPRTGRMLAAAADSIVTIFDVETEKCLHNLRRHANTVHSIAWNATGEYVASVSEDSVRVWAMGPGRSGECVHELVSSGNKYHSCVFHPKYPTLLVIGCYQSLELWNMIENKRMTVNAHSGLVASLAQCPATETMASASHDRTVKVWR